jgi:hypothetical protein
MAPSATTTVRADVTAPPPARPTTSTTRVGATLGRDGRVRLAGLQLAASGPGRLRDVRLAPPPPRPTPVPLPDVLADPVQILAARLGVTARPQPDGWRRDVLVYAMLGDAARTREKGRPTSAAVVLGTHEAAMRLARREGRTTTTGREAAPDNTSFRRSLVRLEQAGLIRREVVRDVEDQERWTVCTLLPLPPTAHDLERDATALHGRWLDERRSSWSTPLRRLVKRRAQNTERSKARTTYRRQLAHVQTRAAIAGSLGAGSGHVVGTQDEQGASPCRSRPLKGSAEKAERAVEKKENAGANGVATPKNRSIEGQGGEAERQVGRLIVAVRPWVGDLSAQEAQRVGNDGLGWLTAAERLRWANVVRRWDRVRHLAVTTDSDWSQATVEEVAAWTMWDATHGAGRVRTNHPALTRDERDGVIRPRPLAIVVRAMHRYTKDLAALAKERRQKAALRTAAAAAIQAPRWVRTDPRTGAPLWRTTWDHIVLLAHQLPDDQTLLRDARHIATLIHAHDTPHHGQVPVTLGIVDRHGNYARISLRRPRGNETPGPRTPSRRAGRQIGRLRR